MALSEKHKSMIRAQLAGRMPHNGEAAFFTSVESWLDANVAQYKDWSGDCTTPHVQQAVSTLLGR